MAAEKCKMRERRNVRQGRPLMLIGSPLAQRAHAPEHRWQRCLRVGAADSADSADSARYGEGEDAYYYYYYHHRHHHDYYYYYRQAH